MRPKKGCDKHDYLVDGDPMPSGQIHVRVLKHALKLFAPPPAPRKFSAAVDPTVLPAATEPTEAPGKHARASVASVAVTPDHLSKAKSRTRRSDYV